MLDSVGKTFGACPVSRMAWCIRAVWAMSLSRRNSVSIAIAVTASWVERVLNGEPPWPSVPRNWNATLYIALPEPQLVLLPVAGCQSTKASRPR